MPKYLVVVWSDETVSIVAESKVIAVDGLDPECAVKMQQGKELWEGKIHSCHDNRSLANQQYNSICPPTTLFAINEDAGKGQRSKKKKEFKDFLDSSDDKNQEQENQHNKKKSNEKDKGEKNERKNNQESGKRKDKPTDQKKEQEKLERAERKRVEENILKEKENLFLMNFEVIEDKEDNKSDTSPFLCGVEHLTTSSPFRSPFKNDTDEENGEAQNNEQNVNKIGLFETRTLPGASPSLSLAESPLSKAVHLDISTPRNFKGHPSKGGKAPRAEFSNNKELPGLKDATKKKITPKKVSSPHRGRYAVKKSLCTGCEEKAKIIRDQTIRIRELQNEADRLQHIINSGSYVDTGCTRSGVLPKDVAMKYKMEEIYTDVYVTQHQLSVLSVKQTATAAANFLIDVFYSKDQQLHMNLTGANGKMAIEPKILMAILGYVRKTFVGEKALSDSAIRFAMRNKLTSYQARQKASSKKKLSY